MLNLWTYYFYINTVKTLYAILCVVRFNSLTLDTLFTNISIYIKFGAKQLFLPTKVLYFINSNNLFMLVHYGTDTFNMKGKGEECQFM